MPPRAPLRTLHATQTSGEDNDVRMTILALAALPLLAGSGTSFVQELTARRLDRASDMLSDPRAGSLGVGEIAFRCGFLDPGYFARAFRKRFGATPSEWRARPV